jgi:hypothetical protein
LSGGARLSTYYVIRLILSRSYKQESLRYAAVAVVGCLPAADAGVGHALDAAGSFLSAVQEQ